jgi:hypothetical protein
MSFAIFAIKSCFVMQPPFETAGTPLPAPRLEPAVIRG